MGLHLFYTILLFLSSSFLFGADSTSNWVQWKNTWSKEKLNLNAIQSQIDSNLVKSVEILDMRSDTSCLGVYTNKSQKPHAVICAVGLTNLFNSKLSNSLSGIDVLLVIKTLWLYKAHRHIQQGSSRPLLGDLIYDDIKEYNKTALLPSQLKCAIDVFILKNGLYYPLTRLDTLFTHRKKINNADDDLIEDVLYSLNKKITLSICANLYSTKRTSGKENIVYNYNKVFDIPLLKDSIIKKGVFYSWDQFKNNQPDNKVFKIQVNEHEPSTVYIKDDNGKEILTRDVFALSDGKRIYKVNEGYVFNLYRDQRSVYWVGIESLYSKTKWVPVLIPTTAVGISGSEAVGSKLKFLFTPYLLNIETGQEY